MTVADKVGQAELDRFVVRVGNSEQQVETSATQLGLRLADLFRNEQTLPGRLQAAIQSESSGNASRD